MGIDGGETIMSEYPPSFPDNPVVVPLPGSELAYTGTSVALLLFAVALSLIFLGVMSIMYVGKKSDKHHTDN